jgi:hypothetical protein
VELSLFRDASPAPWLAELLSSGDTTGGASGAICGAAAADAGTMTFCTTRRHEHPPTGKRPEETESSTLE